MKPDTECDSEISVVRPTDCQVLKTEAGAEVP